MEQFSNSNFKNNAFKTPVRVPMPMRPPLSPPPLHQASFCHPQCQSEATPTFFSIAFSLKHNVDDFGMDNRLTQDNVVQSKHNSNRGNTDDEASQADREVERMYHMKPTSNLRSYKSKTCSRSPVPPTMPDDFSTTSQRFHLVPKMQKFEESD